MNTYHNGKQMVCLCEAYHFPHRFGGGRCDGLSIVIGTRGSSLCDDCFLNNGGCEVIKGQESPRECPGVQEFCHDWELNLP